MFYDLQTFGSQLVVHIRTRGERSVAQTCQWPNAQFNDTTPTTAVMFKIITRDRVAEYSFKIVSFYLYWQRRNYGEK